MKMRRTYAILSGLWAILPLTACQHKDLCYSHPHTVNVNVIFDWRFAPDANPEIVSLYLYPTNGYNALRYDFTDHNGGHIDVPSGHYDALCLNSDTELVRVRGIDSHSEFELFTADTPLLGLLGLAGNPGRGDDDERVSSSPDPLWSDRAVDLDFTQLAESGPSTADWQTREPIRELILYPKAATWNYDISINNVTNLDHVTSFSAALSGLAEGFFPGRGTQSSERVTVPFAMTSDGVSAISGSFCNFGDCPGCNESHELTIYAILSDGSKWYYSFDVTQQIHEATEKILQDPSLKLEIEINLDDLPIPSPIENGEGLQPDVDEWHEIEIDIDM